MAEESAAEFTAEEKAIQRAMAKILFQVDRKVGEESGHTVPDWADTKSDYLKRGSRIMRSLKRQGLEIVATSAFAG